MVLRAQSRVESRLEVCSTVAYVVYTAVSAQHIYERNNQGKIFFKHVYLSYCKALLMYQQ